MGFPRRKFARGLSRRQALHSCQFSPGRIISFCYSRPMGMQSQYVMEIVIYPGPCPTSMTVQWPGQPALLCSQVFTAGGQWHSRFGQIFVQLGPCPIKPDASMVVTGDAPLIGHQPPNPGGTTFWTGCWPAPSWLHHFRPCGFGMDVVRISIWRS